MTETLIVVDMQRTFVDVVGDAGPRVLDAVNRRAADVVASGGTVVYTRDVRPDEHPADHPGNEMDPGLDVVGPVVEKGPGRDGGYSGFLHAVDEPGHGGLGALAAELRRTGTTRVTVVGIAADVCVAATARDAARLGYPTTVALEATAFVGAHARGDDAAVADLRAAGVEIIDWPGRRGEGSADAPASNELS